MDKIRKALSPDRLFIVFVIFNLIVGLLIADDFGVGWDGVFQYRLGEANYKIYTHLFAEKNEDSYGPFSHEYHGPFYQTVAYSFQRLAETLSPNVEPFTGVLFAYYLSFQIGVIFLYLIAKRLLPAWIALTAVLLYSTQPLLFGHAFINPKDTPFLGLMIASVYFGILMVEKYAGSSAPPDPFLRERWARVPEKSKKRLAWFFWIWIFSVLGMIIFNNAIKSRVADLVGFLFQAEPDSIIGVWVSKIAPNQASIGLEAYQGKAVLLSQMGVAALGLIALIIILGSAVKSLAGASKIFSKESGTFIRTFYVVLKQEKTTYAVIAGIALGLTTATRAIAPLAAGGVVVFYFLLRQFRKFLAPTLIYFLTAGLTMYLAWPYMWPAPFSRYLGAINTLSEFPWQGSILYASEVYKSSTLPRSYLPTLIGLQFTEPVIILSIIGVLILLFSWFSNKRGAISTEFVVPTVWFFIPFIAVLIFQPNMYDNFRHFLFITPPLFIFAGLAMEKILDWVKLPVLKMVVVLAILFPGIYQILQLHPYEYIYYNSFVGGVEGAYRNYELDYWATSFREAIEYIDREAGPNARVVIWGPNLSSRLYAREDLDLVFAEELGAEKDLSDYDYGLLLTRTNRDLINATYAQDLFKVVRDNATLVVVRDLRSP